MQNMGIFGINEFLYFLVDSHKHDNYMKRNSVQDREERDKHRLEKMRLSEETAL